MQIQHKQYTARHMGSLGALLGCLIAAAGCASDQEARRGGDTTAHERSREHREARGDAERDVRDDRTREAVMAENDKALDDDVAVKPVPIAKGENVRDNVGDREDVRDNTARDADHNKTDNDQQLSRRIREAIVADDALSTKAKNVEILSKDGAVTLRGPVSTAEEKSRVATHAKNQAGAKRVNNEIEVIR